MRRRTFLVAGAAVLLAGCTDTRPDRTQPSGPAKQGDGTLRTDAGPLLKRFPVLGQPAQVRWMSGTLGDDRVPGPSTYWIDAVVTLAPADAQRLRGAAELHDVSLEVIDGVRAQVPSGRLQGGPALDAALAAQGWEVHGGLVQGTDVLVLVARGGQDA